jgi:hypothetical protein
MKKQQVDSPYSYLHLVVFVYQLRCQFYFVKLSDQMDARILSWLRGDNVEYKENRRMFLKRYT